MEFKRTGDLLEIGDNIRIEAGPRLVTQKATPALIADLLVKATPAALDGADPATEPTLIDAKGAVIEAGSDVQLHNWDGFREGTDRVYWLYRLRERHDDEAEGHNDTHIWAEVGCFDTEELAISAASLSEGA